VQIVYSMQSVIALKRTNVSEQVAEAVRAMIVDGRLAEGERINEVHLSSALGVSRTPLREALGRLAVEGALTSTPNVGYFVRPLTLDEFEDVYGVRPILDPEALRLAGLPSPPRLARLVALNQDLAKARTPEEAIALDDAWHLELLAGCPNRLLLELIENVILRTRRYELALMRETRNVLNATHEHEAILAALGAGDLEAACRALKRNMQSGREPILAWLRARGPNPKAGPRS